VVDGELGDRDATVAAFACAAHVVKFDTWIQRVTGVPMEPRAALGAYDPASGRYTLYAGSGGAWRLKDDLAAILAVPADRVRVLMWDVGGNFGTRGMIYAEFALVAWAARRLARPVKWRTGTRRFFPTTRAAILPCRRNSRSTGTANSSRCAARTSAMPAPTPRIS
jgi:carbon-monoxide dehydrogenase large subunit